MNIAVYCGSATGRKDIYAERARELGTWMTSEGHALVFGAGSVGLMGVMADTMIESGGVTIGVIPEFLVERELGHKGLTETHVVKDMHERKRMMIDRADAFIALPGGVGTLEEISEIISWETLDLIDAPCIVYNVDGFYDDLKSYMEHMVEEGFFAEKSYAAVRFASDLDEVKALLGFR